MFRILNFISVIALLAAAGAVYHVKYASAFEAQKIAKLRDEIRWERDRIATLNAEWARRTAPDRIQALAEHHLDMQPLDVTRMDMLASLPAKPDAAGDALGGMIEALVDSPTGAAIPTSQAKPAAPKPVARAPIAPASAAPRPNGALPLSAVPAAGALASTHAPMLGSPLPPPSARPMATAPMMSPMPLLPPAAVGQ
ncbi:hypothetical protein LGR54_19760 [Ancylobacter sp. Lp-2]|uniref:cell division protein FtsL n=1 Tax=Ancylobacter sp. Lp-2 TaxID=2881339 RepID=UPI001E5CBA07|nr:hypothetical protein [Ancylobacter sp. Lp-2]MCB4770852.1 hypothetical protein [Ancylobacter sp. Lp-2]